MDVDTAIAVRFQEHRMSLDEETRSLLDFAEQVASGNYPPEKIGSVIMRVPRT
jgi:hypothetical protein